MTKNKYENLNEDDAAYLADLREGIINQNELDLTFRGFKFGIEPSGESVSVWGKNELLAEYDSFDDMLENFLLDGKPFIEQISEIEYDDCMD